VTATTKLSANPGRVRSRPGPAGGAVGAVGAVPVSGRRGRPRASQAAGPARYHIDAATTLTVLVAVLNLVGVVMVLSSSSVESIRQYGSPWHYFERDIMWLVVGTVVFTVAFLCDYHRWRRFARAGIVVSLVGLVAVLIPHVGVSVSGASRWLGTSSLQIQPSEFAKVALVFFAADVLDRRGDMPEWKPRMLPVLAAVGCLVLLVMKQPDMGTSMVLVVVALAMLFAAGAPMRALTALLGVGVAGGFVMAVAAPYRWARMTSFLHPMRDATNTGYQAVQGLVSIGSGGLLGTGLGTSIASWGYLPNQQTDFIFAVIAQETGLVGSLVVVSLFAVLVFLGVRIACRAEDRFGALLAAGITAWLGVQAVINIGAVIGLLPVTGVPLPFVSYGGSSLVFSLFGAGVLANVARSR
jgi:cell division protein FtsW